MTAVLPLTPFPSGGQHQAEESLDQQYADRPPPSSATVKAATASQVLAGQATLPHRHSSLVGSRGGGAVTRHANPAESAADPAGGPDADRLDRLLAERGDHLLHAAIALTGSRPDAEDLVQAAVERLLRRRRRVDDLEAYLRRILYSLAADGWRRRGTWRRKSRLAFPRPDDETGADSVATVDLRDALVRALRQLPPRQRAVLVLRYWEQRTQAETAGLLGCSEGTVKSAASRGLTRLPVLTAPWHDPQPHLAHDGARIRETP
jgi:RNA polymerase sigma-70 factor (sigma-E family)